MSATPELVWLWIGVSGYAVASFGAIRAFGIGMSGGGLFRIGAPAIDGPDPDGTDPDGHEAGGRGSGGSGARRGIALLSFATMAVAGAIAVRWARLEQGPFLTMFDVLLSNLFSLGLIYTLVYARVPVLRSGAIVVLPLLSLLGAWALSSSPEPVPLPATFHHPWLWLHVLFGKLFLGPCLVGASVSSLLLLRGVVPRSRAFAALASTAALDTWVWRLMSLAFLFQSLMLIAGAVWAHDAWGRYWAWDPLETWAFVTWLALGALLHARITVRLPPALAHILVIGVFVLAFLTFFGVPFLNSAPHKGVM